MLIQQVSVFMENRPGRLSEITKILSDNNIDVRAVNISDSTEFGILRMIVNDAERTEKVLRQNHMTANIADVFAVSMDDSIGSFSHVIATLKEKDINIEYLYSFIGEKTRAVLVIKTNDNEKACKWLKENNICVLSLEDLN